MNGRILTLVGAGYLLAVAGIAHAGGFARSSADTDILFKDDRFAARSSGTLVSTSRKYSRNPNNPALVGTDYVATNTIPSAAVKAALGDNLRCAGNYVNAFGGHADYDSPKNAARPTPMGGGIANSGKRDEEFMVYETGVTFAAGPGHAFLLVGVFQEEFDYGRLDILTASGLPGIADGTAIGRTIILTRSDA